MKKILLFLVLIFVGFSVNAQKRLTNAEFKSMMKDKNAQILDVRTAKEVAEGKIDGSVNIDYFSPNFLEKASKLDKNKPVLIYCAAGGRSLSAAKDLKKAGFKKVYDLQGGFDNWKE
ncbi:MAG: rhodanese-like domain-containing protein [Flavobacteriales bacterium]|nr:rhodanese-like domain-containing protein [Crocinitomicaceae bacterium]NBX78826.1 rhodanese-like domain-containing protein [Flavobacteriales bacterium]NCA22647.1 rhodanese-like domain-containing protein [Crocinitomicaceae bacterium]